MRMQAFVAVALIASVACASHLTRKPSSSTGGVRLVSGRCSFQLVQADAALFSCGMDLTAAELTVDERARLAVLTERITTEVGLSDYRVRRLPVVDNDQGVSLVLGSSHWYIPAQAVTSMPQAVLDLRDFAECCFRSHFGGPGFFVDRDGRYAVKPNCAVNASHSAVTARAYGGTRRAVGRARYRER